MASGHEDRRTWAVFVTSMTLFACGAVWMVTAAGDVDRPGVLVDREEKSPEEIREYWTPKRIREAEPAEMPVVHPCEGVKSLLEPDCW